MKLSEITKAIEIAYEKNHELYELEFDTDLSIKDLIDQLYKVKKKYLIDFVYTTDIEPKNMLEWLEEKIDDEVGGADFFENCVDNPSNDDLVVRNNVECLPIEFFAKVNEKLYKLDILIEVVYIHEAQSRCYVGSEEFKIDRITEIVTWMN